MMEVYEHLFSPHEEHLNDVYKIFSYLQNNISKNPGRIAFDTYCAPTNDQLFKGSTREPYAAEAHLRNKLEPLGEPVTARVYVDTNHAGNLSNRRSHSRILIYVNNTLIKFYSKSNNTVESSSFGSECMASRLVTVMVESLRYKLSIYFCKP